MDKNNNNQKKKSHSKKTDDSSEYDSNKDKVEIEKNRERRKYKQANNKINTRREHKKEGNRSAAGTGGPRGTGGQRQDKYKNLSVVQESERSETKNKSKIKGSIVRKNRDRQTSSTSSTTMTSSSSSQSDSRSDIDSSSTTTLDTHSDKSFSARIDDRKKNKRPRAAGSRIPSSFVHKLDNKKLVKNRQKNDDDDPSATFSSSESSINRGKKSNRHRRPVSDYSEYTIRDRYIHGNDNIGHLGKKESALIQKIIKVFSDNQDLYKKNISLENKILDCQQKIIKRSRNLEVLELISKIFKLDRDINVINTIILKSNLPKRISQNASLADKLSSQYLIVCDVNQEYKSDLKSNNSKCEFYNKMMEFSETDQIKKFRAEKDRLEKILDKLKVDAKLVRF